MMTQPWQQPEPDMPDPVAAWPYEVIDAIRDLGVLKPGEVPVTTHAHDCPIPKDLMARCTCPGGPEVIWPDWDERGRPIRHYVVPERFYVNR